MPKRRDDNGSTPPGDFEDSPSGAHRRPAGSDESWREKTDPHADARVKGQWWMRPVTLPWGMLLAVGGVGAGGTGGALIRQFVPEDVVTDARLESRLSVLERERAAERDATDRKLDALSRDITNLHEDVDALTEILDRAFPRFPDRRTPP